MNKTLALFFNDDYLAAAVQPVDGKFTILSSTDDKKFYFYFYTVPTSATVEFGFDYKKLYQDKHNLYYGDLIKNIEENNSYMLGNIEQNYVTFFSCIIKTIRELYSNELKKYDSAFYCNDDTEIDAVAMFSDNISDNVKNKIKNYFSTKKINISRNENIDGIVVSYFTSKKGYYCTNRKFAVLEALGYNLNMSIVTADQNTFSRQEYKQFKGYGIDPMIKVIAEQIVNSVNRSEHLIDFENKQEIQEEINRHYDKAEKVIAYFEKNPEKQTIRLSTVFACNPNTKIPINLSLTDISKTAYSVSRQYSAFFTNSFLEPNKINSNDVENIILVGNSLGGQSIIQEFKSFGESKIQNFSDTEAMQFMIELFKEKSQAQDSDYQDEEGTMFLAQNKPEPIPQKPEPKIQEQPKPTFNPNVYHEVDSITIGALKPGTKVYLDTFDPTPGKGKAHQELEYQGGGQFVILSSSRSLIFGDLVEPLAPVWTKGVNLLFVVVRDGRNLGKFKTRVVTKISVK